ncbi:MAG: hypothetical protein ACTSR8_04620 [Promethearchaeota archaeon]
MTLEMVLAHDSRDDIYLRVIVPNNRVNEQDRCYVNQILMNEFDLPYVIF